VLAITNAKRTAAITFTFPGDPTPITLNPNVGYFITMNPGYQGRQELPENLKVLFRSVSMMVPDREIIMKVKLCSVGYQGFGELARKFNVLYRLCEQQLSKQKHYDFGLRNILSVLRTAGKTKRDNSRAPEEGLLMRTLRDMNLSKLVAQDVPLFLSLLSDLFPQPGPVQTNNANADVERAIEVSIQKAKLISYKTWNIKIVQLYETTLVRHGIMMVGPAGAGKSMIIQTLQDALTSTTGITYKRVRMNPKAIRAEEMFGETDKLSGEWLDGVFAAMWTKYNDRSRKDIQWIICDGPIDAIWIENLNTVLDDNKILTLANGDRIPMTDNVKLMFEVEDLRNASPATVSRAGIIYVSTTDLDWGPVMEGWLVTLPEQRASILRGLVFKYLGRCDGNKDVGHIFTFMAKRCNMVVKTGRVHLVESCIRLFTGLLAGANLSDSVSDLTDELEKIFLFCLTWSVGGLLETEDRSRMDAYLRALSKLMPPLASADSTVYDFSFNLETLDWERWQPPSWEYPKYTAEPNYASLLVPTTDTCQSLFLLNNLQKQRKAVLMSGGGGTAKTSTALMFFDAVMESGSKMLLKKINFSSATTAGMFQRTIEGELDKRGGKSFGPPGGRKMTVFLDDLNMPEVNVWGDQPTLEVIRQLIEQGNVSFLDKDKRGDLKTIEDLQYVGAMSQPGAGKNDIPNRLKRHFYMFNLILPSVPSINKIYGKILEGRFPNGEFPGVFITLARGLPDATIRLWTWMRLKMLPSPTKFHYIFNLRELSRIFHGIVRTPKESLVDEVMLIRLWRHECERVFADKLTTVADKKAFNAQLVAQVVSLIQAPILDVIKANKNSPPELGQEVLEKCTSEAFFVDFLRDDVYDDDGVLVQAAPHIYELGPPMAALKERVGYFLDRHNNEFPAQRMNLVLFDDAMRHLMRLTRAMGTPRGNMLLVGVGGSGKQSLTRLASFMSGNKTFQISITKTYNFNSLMDDVRELYKQCGQGNLQITFLFTEAEIKDENFLEVINSILMTGEVTNLFPKDEFQVRF
jgi:dynein heavy chain, axonemal